MQPAVTVSARPAPVELRPGRTAVIVVDMQHDFASEGGMFDRAGIDLTAIKEIVGPIAEVLDAARASGMLVVYLKMAFSADLSDAGYPDGPTWLKHIPLRAGDTVAAPDGSASRILIRDSWNTDIVEELAPMAGDVVLYKSRYSGFYETELEATLRAHQIDTIVFVGATTSVCVESTVRDATFRDFHCLVLSDCTAEPIGADTPRSNHDASLHVLELLFASISDSRSLLSSLREAAV
ncbi:MAG TPA: cysteine hydrolase [Acidimicrobiales bacterium]|nr:cysteine hydrolase [Acidimicrobiales bacterium]